MTAKSLTLNMKITHLHLAVSHIFMLFFTNLPNLKCAFSYLLAGNYTTVYMYMYVHIYVYVYMYVTWEAYTLYVNILLNDRVFVWYHMNFQTLAAVLYTCIHYTPTYTYMYIQSRQYLYMYMVHVRTCTYSWTSKCMFLIATIKYIHVVYDFMLCVYLYLILGTSMGIARGSRERWHGHLKRAAVLKSQYWLSGWGNLHVIVFIHYLLYM